MAKPMKSVLNVASDGVALEGVSEGARRATGNTTSRGIKGVRLEYFCG